MRNGIYKGRCNGSASASLVVHDMEKRLFLKGNAAHQAELLHPAVGHRESDRSVSLDCPARVNTSLSLYPFFFGICSVLLGSVLLQSASPK